MVMVLIPLMTMMKKKRCHMEFALIGMTSYLDQLVQCAVELLVVIKALMQIFYYIPYYDLVDTATSVDLVDKEA